MRGRGAGARHGHGVATGWGRRRGPDRQRRAAARRDRAGVEGRGRPRGQTAGAQRHRLRVPAGHGGAHGRGHALALNHSHAARTGADREVVRHRGHDSGGCAESRDVAPSIARSNRVSVDLTGMHRVVGVTRRADVGEDQAIANHVVAGDHSVVRGRIPGELDREG